MPSRVSRPLTCTICAALHQRQAASLPSKCAHVDVCTRRSTPTRTSLAVCCSDLDIAPDGRIYFTDSSIIPPALNEAPRPW